MLHVGVGLVYFSFSEYVMVFSLEILEREMVLETFVA
jgi:hypothetical protein